MSTSRGRAALSAAHWEPCRQLDLFPNTIIQSQYNFGTWNSTSRIRFVRFFRFFLFFSGFFPVLVLKTTLKFTKLDIFCFLDPSWAQDHSGMDVAFQNQFWTRTRSGFVDFSTKNGKKPEKYRKKPEKREKPDPGSTVSWPKVVWELYYGVCKKIKLPT